MWEVKLLLKQAASCVKKHWPVVLLVVAGLAVLKQTC